MLRDLLAGVLFNHCRLVVIDNNDDLLMAMFNSYSKVVHFACSS